MAKASLVVMAAGMASRYGSAKQIEGMGPNGEILMEYSIYDALRAGFDKVVFIIAPGMLEDMKELCGDRIAKQAEVCYAVQDYSSIPSFYTIPEARVKPFGTVHAVLCAKDVVNEPFAIINADDYYGVEPYAQMFEFLTGAADDTHASMMGFRLKNTVSTNGTVTRGVCRTDDGFLTEVVETKKIALLPDGSIQDIADPDAPKPLDGEACVSMNFWGFAPSIFNAMEEYFHAFLKALPATEIKEECLLPVFVDKMLHKDLRVSVLPTNAVWFGVTYKEDRPPCVAALKELHDKGVYPKIHEVCEG